MGKALFLAVCRDKAVVETVKLVSIPECVSALSPKKQPTFWSCDKKTCWWSIGADRRRAFAEHVTKKMEEFNRKSLGNLNSEEVCCFFSLVGIGKKWIEEKEDWMLVLTENIREGDLLDGKEDKQGKEA